MTNQTVNKKVILSIVFGLIAIPLGVFGWLAMYVVGTLDAVYIPHIISAIASVIAISIAFQGIGEIDTHGETQKGKGIGIIGIAIGALNFLLLIIYYASY
jgi:hypothetical protein